jgi:hypothetical protein
LQATTGNLKKVKSSELAREIKHPPLAILVLAAILLTIIVFGDSIHQALDPAYKKQVLDDEKSQKQLNDALNQIERAQK